MKRSLNQAKIVAINRNKGRVSLLARNGLVTTGSYLYDLKDLRVGMSVLIGKVDDSYVILNKIDNMAREGVSFSVQDIRNVAVWSFGDVGYTGDESPRALSFTAKSIYGGDYADQVFAIRADGSLWGIGDGELLGMGNYDWYEEFTQIGNDKWSMMSSGEGWSLGMKLDGTIWGTGNNYYGNLGVGDRNPRMVWTQESRLDRDWIYVVSGWFSSSAIKRDSTLWGAGSSYVGELGFADGYYTSYTKMSDGFWKYVSCGQSGQHTLAIKSDDTLWGTGRNNNGELGLGHYDYFVRGLTQIGSDLWSMVAASSYGSFGIKKDGTLWGTGENKYGQLGQGDYEDRCVFTQIGTSSDWKYVTTGVNHMVALKNDGTIWGTGRNVYGELGLPQVYPYKFNILTQLGTDVDWRFIAGWINGTLLLKSQ